MNRRLGWVLPAVLLSSVALPSTARAEPPTKMNSTGLVVGGSVLAVIGLGSLVGAIWVTVNDLSKPDKNQGFTTLLIGAPLFASALGGLGPGIPMIAIGTKRIPIPNGVSPSSVRLAPTATFTWQF